MFWRRPSLSPVLVAVVAAAVVFSASMASDVKSLKRAEELVMAAQREVERGDLEDAHRRIVKALQKEPSFPAAHLLLGHLDMRAGRFAGALAHYENARDGHVEHAERVRQIKARQYARARQRIAQIRDALRTAAVYGVRVRGIERSRAENEIRRLQSLKPPDPDMEPEVPAEILFHIGNAHFRLGHVEKAQAAWELCCEQRPKFPLPFYNLGLLHAQLGNPYLALWHLERAEELGFDGDPSLRKKVRALIESSPRL
jgi:tetratricopeptide (TPR) repeat protein